MKCLPLKCSTNGFGAVKLIRFAGWNFAPGPLLGGPSSILQEEGASTDVTGTVVCSRADIIAENGGRTSPEKLKPSGVLDSYLKGAKWGRKIPKMASITWFVLLRSDSKSSENLILRFFSCSASRCETISMRSNTCSHES